MNSVCGYSIAEYIKKLTDFHGNFAPGLFIGGYMVDIAKRHVCQYEIFDAICESPACLPDAIQMLTPCTIGNGWLKIVDTGRFAIALYEKTGGHGVRVSLDAAKLDAYPEIKNWFLRLTAKSEQNRDDLIQQIIDAGDDIYSVREVAVSPGLLRKHKHGGRIALCVSCGEAYPEEDGTACLACQGMDIYRLLCR
jgi:formylmethanofuran dehydrogenase subunit E